MRPSVLLAVSLPLVACSISNPLFELDPGEVTTTTTTTAPVATTDGPPATTDTPTSTTEPLPVDTTSTTGPVDPVTTLEPDPTTGSTQGTTDTTGGPDLCEYAGSFPIDPQIYVDLDPKMPMKACKQLSFTAKGSLEMEDGVLAIHQAGSCDDPDEGPLYYFGLGYPAGDLEINCAEIRVGWAGPMGDCRIGTLEVRNLNNNAIIYLGVFDQLTPPNFPLQPKLVEVDKCGCDLSQCCVPLDPGQYSLEVAGVTIDAGTSADLVVMNTKGRFHNFRSHITPECQQNPITGHYIEWFAAAL